MKENDDIYKEKQEIVETSKVVYNDTLYEQVYNPKRKHSYYIGWDKQKKQTIPIEYIEDIGNIKYIPIHDKLLNDGAVILPKEPLDYHSTQDLELEIKTFIEQWLDISEEHLQKATWYIMLSWVYDKLYTIPYLRALGDYGTGKTRYLDVIGGLCYKPMFVGGSVRSAPIYRIIDLWKGTAIFDEFNLQHSTENEDIIQILNNGFQRGKPVLRCRDRDLKVESFDPFCPKILSSRKQFHDRALESRCITEIMQMTTRTDIPTDYTTEFYKKREELQNKLLMYRFKNWDKINPDQSINIDFGDIQPRIKQSFYPFTVLFQHNQELLNKFITEVQNYNREIILENSMSFDGQIINHYIKLLEQHEQQQLHADDYVPPKITASDIRENMIINDGWKEDTLKTTTIGRHLKALGFESKPQTINGKTQRIITIDDKKFEILKKRYIPSPELQ
ncbi:MAG: hypothetical protein ACTSW1_00225 [Candidatus Hodarchaeales archaeon]